MIVSFVSPFHFVWFSLDHRNHQSTILVFSLSFHLFQRHETRWLSGRQFFATPLSWTNNWVYHYAAASICPQEWSTRARSHSRELEPSPDMSGSLTPFRWQWHPRPAFDTTVFKSVKEHKLVSAIKTSEDATFSHWSTYLDRVFASSGARHRICLHRPNCLVGAPSDVAQIGRSAAKGARVITFV
jgi:hypothetical protein